METHLLNSPDGQHQRDDLIAPFDKSEISGGIKRLKTGKASSFDIVNNEILKAMADIITPILVLFFNNILKNETFPIAWSIGLLIPLFKSGENDDPNNYRGNTISSCLSKLVMLLLNDRMSKFCEDNSVIHYNQIGFRKGFRPADHVFTLKTMIDQAFSNKKKLYTCFVDFKKAYDTIWRDGLYYKLIQNGVNNGFIRLLKNIYSNSLLCIQLPFGVSSTFPSNIGLKQGCNLSPILFNLFINDFIDGLRSHNKSAACLQGLPINCLLYADDLVLISESEEGLQDLLDKLYQFASSWFLEINPKKTKCVTFSRSVKGTNKTMVFGDTVISYADSYCYLGNLLSSNGSLNKAGHTLHDKAIKAMYAITRKIYKYNTCSIKTMVNIFDKMILPIATYNSEIWGTMCFPVNKKNTKFIHIDNRKNPVEDLQVKFCKRLLRVSDKTTNWAVISEIGRYPTCILVISSMIKFWFHLTQSSSPILNAALQTSVGLSVLSYNSWFTYCWMLSFICIRVPFNIYLYLS